MSHFYNKFKGNNCKSAYFICPISPMFIPSYFLIQKWTNTMFLLLCTSKVVKFYNNTCSCYKCTATLNMPNYKSPVNSDSELNFKLRL